MNESNAITVMPGRLANMRQVVAQYQREMEQNEKRIKAASKPNDRADLSATAPRPMAVLLAVLQYV